MGVLMSVGEWETVMILVMALRLRRHSCSGNWENCGRDVTVSFHYNGAVDSRIGGVQCRYESSWSTTITTL